LGEGTFGHGANRGAGEGGKQLVEARLQTALEGAQQEGDENGKGEDALAGEGGGSGAMFGDEVRVAEDLRQMGKNRGMEPAKWLSWDCPVVSKCYVQIIPQIGLT
jgi:hypothetical protein